MHEFIRQHSELCRHKGIATSLYYTWSKDLNLPRSGWSAKRHSMLCLTRLTCFPKSRPFKIGIFHLISHSRDEENFIKKSKFTKSQITFILKQADDGVSVAEVYRKAGISDATFYSWRKKYAGLMPSEMRWTRQLEEENAKLKRIVADLSLDKAMLQDVLAKKR